MPRSDTTYIAIRHTALQQKKEIMKLDARQIEARVSELREEIKTLVKQLRFAREQEDFGWADNIESDLRHIERELLGFGIQ